MARGDVEGLARTIEASGIAELEHPTAALWALVSYTYFDTRWTPLAGVNVYDVDRSLLARDGFKRNSPEAFPLIRIAFLFRGAQARCGVFDCSLVDAWLPDALQRLGRPVARTADAVRRAPQAVEGRGARVVGAQKLGRGKVHELTLAPLVQHDVRGPHVAVGDLGVVAERERREDLARDARAVARTQAVR